MTERVNYMQRVGFSRCIRCDFTTEGISDFSEQDKALHLHLEEKHPGWMTDGFKPSIAPASHYESASAAKEDAEAFVGAAVVDARVCENCEQPFGNHWGPDNLCEEGREATWRYIHPSADPEPQPAVSELPELSWTAAQSSCEGSFKLACEERERQLSASIAREKALQQEVAEAKRNLEDAMYGQRERQKQFTKMADMADEAITHRDALRAEVAIWKNRYEIMFHQRDKLQEAITMAEPELTALRASRDELLETAAEFLKEIPIWAYRDRQEALRSAISRAEQIGRKG